MPGHTRVILLRLQEGGLLMVAPAAVLPWPQVLSRNARHLQGMGLRRALKDPGAMQILRREYPQLLNLPAARAGALFSDHQLVQAYLHAAQRDLVTVIYGHAESSYGERPQSVQQRVAAYANPEVQRQVRAIGTFAAELMEIPSQSVPMPNSLEERLTWSAARATNYMEPAEYEAFEVFFAPEEFGVTVASLLVWGSRHVVGVGFVVDAAVFAHAYWRNGSQGLKAMDQLKRFFDLTRNPGGWGELDEAAQGLAVAMSALGPATFRQLLRRVGTTAMVRGGEGGQDQRESRPQP